MSEQEHRAAKNHHTIEVTGRVLDADAAGDTGLPGVAVSDGATVTLTDNAGRYRLEADPERRRTLLVHITVPAGYRVVLDDANIPRFFHRLDPDPGARHIEVDFHLHAAPASADERYRFIQLTDVHVQAGTPNTAATVGRRFERVVELAIGTGPAPRFTVVSGDLTNDATDAEFHDFRAAAARSPLPVWPVPGNHDLTGQPPGGPYPTRRSRPPYPEAIDAYRRLVGPEWYSFQHGRHHFVMLDNYRGLTDPDQYRWLEQDLAAHADGRELVVVAHVPWNVPQTRNPDRAAAYLKLLASHRVRLLLAGHIHGNDVATDVIDGALHTVTTSTAFSLDQTPPGFRVVDMRPGAVTATFVTVPTVTRRPATASTAAATDRADDDGTSAPAAPPRQGEPWPMFHRDPRHAGASAETVRPPLRRAWTHATGGTILTSSPAVAHGTVYLGVRDENGADGNGVVAVDLASGRRRWWAATPGAVEASVAVSGDLVLAPAVRGPLHALDAATGQPRWAWRPEHAGERHCWMYFSPTVRDGTVYQGYNTASGTWLAALAALTGRTVWHTSAPIGRNWLSHGSPAVADGRVVFASAYANLVALDAADGVHHWQVPFHGWTRSMPVLVGDVALLACQGDRVVAVDVATGEQRWQYTSGGDPLVAGAATSATPAVADGMLYAAFADGSVTALRLTDGSPVWRVELGAALTASPTVSGPLLYVGSDDGYLRALDRADGTCLWSAGLGARVASSPVVTGNTVLAATWDGTLHAFAA